MPFLLKDNHRIAFAVSMVLSAALLWYFHDRFWWPPDDGWYAYLSQRMLAGDLVNRDLSDLHGGLGNFVNTAAMALFGEDILSLRYPLILMALLQCAIAYRLLRQHGALVAGAGVFLAASFSFIQFPNPNPNWLGLLLFFVIALVLTTRDSRQAGTLCLIGALLACLFLTRQLNGVIVAIGVVSWLTLRLSSPDAPDRLGGRILGAIMATGLIFYLADKGSLFGYLWIGIWPLLLLFLIVRHSSLSLAAAVRMAAWMGAGFVAAFLPMLAYHLALGTLGDWVHDVILIALDVHNLYFMTKPSMLIFLIRGIQQLVMPESLAAWLNGFLWLTLVALPPLLGLTVFRRLRAAGANVDAVPPISFLMVFTWVLALHYQIPIYFFFVTAGGVIAWVALAPGRATVPVLLGAACVAIFYQAAQPLSRGILGIAEGRRIEQVAARLPGATLVIEADDIEAFSNLIAHIEAHAGEGEALMTLPSEPELNFMTRRKSPVRYYNAGFALQGPEDIADTMARLRQAAPLFVVFRRQDKYTTLLVKQALEEIKADAGPPVAFGPFDLYRYEPD